MAFRIGPRLEGAAVVAMVCGALAGIIGVHLRGTLLVAAAAAALWSLTMMRSTNTVNSPPRVISPSVEGARLEIARMSWSLGSRTLTTAPTMRRLTEVAARRLAGLGLDANDRTDAAQVERAIGGLAYRALFSDTPVPLRRSQVSRCIDAIEALKTPGNKADSRGRGVASR